MAGGGEKGPENSVPDPSPLYAHSLCRQKTSGSGVLGGWKPALGGPGAPTPGLGLGSHLCPRPVCARGASACAALGLSHLLLT